MTDPKQITMKALRLETYGKPLDVVRLDDVPIPNPGTGQVRVRVHACALNPADWFVCEGFVPGPLPRGIGFDVSGMVDALGEGVTSVNLGDLVFGVPDHVGQPTCGAAEYAVLTVFLPIPKGLDITEAAALPMATETAARTIDLLPLAAGQTLMVNGGGTMTGFAAVQIALLRGAHVRKAAREHKEMKFTALLHHVTVDLLRDSFGSLKRKATPGVDGMTWQAYESGLEDRLRRNYKTAVPQYYQGFVQLLLPLTLTDPARADLALVVERFSDFYRAATCLTLDMAYNNARQLARPDRDWLAP